MAKIAFAPLTENPRKSQFSGARKLRLRPVIRGEARELYDFYAGPDRPHKGYAVFGYISPNYITRATEGPRFRTLKEARDWFHKQTGIMPATTARRSGGIKKNPRRSRRVVGRKRSVRRSIKRAAHWLLQGVAGKKRWWYTTHMSFSDKRADALSYKSESAAVHMAKDLIKFRRVPRPIKALKVVKA